MSCKAVACTLVFSLLSAQELEAELAEQPCPDAVPWPHGAAMPVRAFSRVWRPRTICLHRYLNQNRLINLAVEQFDGLTALQDLCVRPPRASRQP